MVTFQPRATSQRATKSTARPSSPDADSMAMSSAASATTSVMAQQTSPACNAMLRRSRACGAMLDATQRFSLYGGVHKGLHEAGALTRGAKTRTFARPEDAPKLTSNQH